MEQTDLRIIKTRKALVSAMVEALHKKNFDDISVQYLCDKAMVRRATFYSHFADKYELFSYTIRCIYQEFPSYQQAQQQGDLQDLYNTMVADAIHFLSDNTAVVKSLMNSQLTHLVLNIVRSELEKDLLPLMETNMQRHHKNPKLTFHFYLHGVFGSFLWWLQEGNPISKEALITQVQEIFPLS